jgi:exopolysaccharide biosynthesis WecB/TagA/CpsF family protein
MNTENALAWPAKKNLFGVQVSATRYHEVVHTVIAAAQRRQRGVVTFLPVHGIVTAVIDAAYRSRVNRCEIVAPDGQPVRWALNFFHKSRLEDRVYGPETMRQLCQKAAQAGVSIYLCGSTPQVLNQLEARMVEMFPGLQVAGKDSPPFRPMTPQENDALCERINRSGAGLAFIGLGCPRQEIFAQDNRQRIQAVQLCVGAAFDFHAGNKKMAPPILQRFGLEWLYRLTQEPRRLWKRYLVTNSIFVALVMKDMLKGLGWLRRPSAQEGAQALTRPIAVLAQRVNRFGHKPGS